MSPEPLTESLRDTLGVFDVGIPRTTPEVADELDLGRRSTYSRLERLVEEDRLDTKKVGANARVWWRPPTENTVGDDATLAANLGEVGVGVSIVNESLDIVWINEAFERCFGVDRDEVIGKDTRQLIEEEIAPIVEDSDAFNELVLSTYSDNAEPEHFTCHVTPDSDRAERWLEYRSTAIESGPYEGGRIELYHDVSGQPPGEQEETRREDRDFVEGVLQAAPIGVMVIQEDGRFTTANRRAAELLDLDHGTNTVGINEVYDEDGEYLPPEERPYLRVFETGESVRDWHAQIERNDGTRRWLSTNIEPISEDGDVTKVIVTVQDISRAKAQAARLERQRDDLSAELDDIFTRIDDAFMAIDADWRISYVNERAVELVQVPVGELLGSRVWDALPEVADGEPRNMAEQAMETNETFQFEFYSDILEIWYEVHGYPSETGMSVYFRDITERKERERELEQYETLVETVPDGAYVLDEEYHYQFVNEAYAEMVGYPREELLGAHASKVVSEEAMEESAGLREQLLAGERTFAVIEQELETAEGEKVPVETRSMLLPFDEQFRGTAGVSRDITERRARERELQQTKSQLEAATLAGEIGTWEWYIPEDNFFTGEWFARLFGVDPQAAEEGISLEALISSIHEDDRDRVASAIEEAVANCASYEEEYRVWDANDDLRWVVARGEVDCDDGEPVAFPGALTDITERKQAELTLDRQREQLAALNSLNKVVQGLTNAVIDQSTREQIEETVCEHLADSDSYKFAWIGEVDSSQRAVNLRSEAGVEGDLADRSVSLEPDGERLGLIGSAMRDGEIQICQDIQSEPDLPVHRESSLEHGFQSVAAVPIPYEDTVYGILTIYSERRSAFADQERELIAYLGEIVGHAIASTERKRALMSDELIELEFQVRDLFAGADSTIEGTGTITFQNVVPVEDGEFIVYGTATNDAMETLTDFVDAMPTWESLTVRSEQEPIRFEILTIEPPVLSTVASIGGYLDTAIVENGDLRLVIHLAPTVDVRRVLDVIEEEYPDAQLLRRRQITRSGDDSHHFRARFLNELTDRQQTVLEASLHAGFFEWPRSASGEEVAESLGIAPATFSQHLRKAEKQVFEELLATSPSGP